MTLARQIENLSKTVQKDPIRSYSGKVCHNEGLLFTTDGYRLTWITPNEPLPGPGTFSASGFEENKIPPMVKAVISSITEKSPLFTLDGSNLKYLLLLCKSLKSNKKLAIGITKDKTIFVTHTDEVGRFIDTYFFNPDSVNAALCYEPTWANVYEDTLYFSNDEYQTITTAIKG